MGAVFLSRVPVNMLIRNGKYHYRKRIPAALVDFFSRKEITKSLGTGEIRQASRLNNYIDGQVEKLFHACRFNSLTSDIARANLKTILNGGSPPESQDNQPATIVIAAPTQRKGKRLSDAIEAFSNEKVHGWTTKTKKEYAGVFNRLLKGLTDPRLQDLARPALVEYRDVLVREDKSIKTVNKYLGILSTVLRHANRLKWIQGNPADGLGLKDNRRPDEVRRIFTTAEIAIIFNALQRDKQSFYDKGRHERYWLPLLGIFTGARVNELAQLDTKDIGIEKGIPVIFICATENDDKRLKNESSKRTIPLHPNLLTLGFLVYVNNIRQQGHVKLFPALKPGPNGYQHYFNSHHFAGSKGWLRQQLPELEKGGAFHIFRHTFATMLKDTEVEERLLEEIMGHKLSSQSMGRYGKPYKADVRIRAINKIQYGLVPQVTKDSSVFQNEEHGGMEEHEFLVCGKTRIRIYPDDGVTPEELPQYKRPDLHGYSPFHQEILLFMPDGILLPS